MEKTKKFGLIPQVLILFAISVLVTGVITFLIEQSLSDSSIRQQTETIAMEIAEESEAAVRKYPAYEWLLSYWYAHADELDVEYDVGFEPGTQTEQKCRTLCEQCPGLQLEYVTEEVLETMNPGDQKLYAEIAYTWVLAELNQVKQAHNLAFLFFAMADETYEKQFFLLSAADPGAVRGNTYGEFYLLGNVSTVGEDQQEAMRSAREHTSHLAYAGDYMDFYIWFGETEGYPVFIGMTYDLSVIRALSASQARRETCYAMIFQIILCVICLLLVYRFVLRPLKKVQKSIRLYKQTKDSKQVTESLLGIRSYNEIGELAEDVSELAVEMDDYVARMATITAEKERASTELNMATRIQEGMLPHVFPAFPNRSDFDVYAAMDPAREVGGDFYDFFLVDDDHLCLMIADVSGKGIPAALFMMAVKIILQSCAMLGGSPSEILTRTNEAVCSNNQAEMFVTVWLGILELSTGKLTAANAGHEYPVLCRPDGQFEIVRDKHGFVIGGMDGMKYKEYMLNLEPGSKLFVYTDGVPEATSAGQELFGTERMLDALNSEPQASPEGILKNVRRAVDGFVKDAEQFDDLTMLCMEYKGSKEK